MTTTTGLDGVVVAHTVLSEVDGLNGRLVIRGARVEDLAGHVPFESVAARLDPGLTVVHFNGVFHSDEGMGAVEGLKRRRPGLDPMVVSITKGASPEPAKRALGDFVVWTP